MTSLALNDIEPELLEELSRRAKYLGTTIEREALRALREYVAKPTAPPAAAPESVRPEPAASQALAEDPRFVRKNGVWVFTGQVDPDLIPDHRDLREERIDAFVKAALGEDSD
jgi:uncharacterized protein YchJ